MQPDQATIDHLKAEHGEGLTLLEADEVCCIVKPVEMGQYRLFKKQVSDEATVSTAGENLLYAVLVWPKREDLQRELRGRPFILERLADQVLKAAGSEAEVVAKKL
jgi:hypothetical protein